MVVPAGETPGDPLSLQALCGHHTILSLVQTSIPHLLSCRAPYMFLTGVAIRLTSRIVFLGKSVLKGCGLADLQCDAFFACFPEILMIWDSVSECIRKHLAQDRVGLAPRSSPREPLRACLVRTMPCHRVPSLPRSESRNGRLAGHNCVLTHVAQTSFSGT